MENKTTFIKSINRSDNVKSHQDTNVDSPPEVLGQKAAERYTSLDFELYYDKDISIDSKNPRSLSPESYAQKLKDNREIPYLISLYDGTNQYVGPLKDVPWEKFPSATIVCHNARFDHAIFKAWAGDLLPASWLKKRWLCTADMAAYNQSRRSLKAAAKFLLGVDVSKEVRNNMKGVHFETLSPEKKTEVTKYALNDAVLCHQLAEKLLPSWPEIEQDISIINREQGEYGVQLDEEYIAKGIQKLHQIKFDAEKKLPWREDPDSDTAVLSPKAACRLCGQAGIPVPTRLDTDGTRKVTFNQDEPEVIAWETEYGEKYPWVSAMRDYRKANILLRKLQTMNRHSVNGILYYGLLYFGAHTGRFSGGGGLNMQNLPGRKESFVSLRRAIVARPGKELCVIDWRQIEPRILRWAVKDKVALDLLAKGISIYEAYAIQHFKWKGSDLKEKNPALYGLAKAAVLGAGYGCGAARYQGVAKRMADLDLSAEEASQQVALFRKDNPLVVGLWNRLNFAARLNAVKQKDFSIKLPSGRSLYYYKPRMTNGLKAYPLRDLSKPSFLHGGLLTENFVQAIARDVFTLGMWRLAQNKVCDLFHVHDEYVLELDKGDHEEQERSLREIILAPIPWLPDCPLDVEFKWRLNYGG